MKRILFTTILAIVVVISQAKGPTAADVSMSSNHAPLAFKENKGQVMDQNRQPRSDIQFGISAAPGLNIFIGNGAIHYQFSKGDSADLAKQAKCQYANPVELKEKLKRGGDEMVTYTMHRMDVELIGNNKHAEVIAEEKQDYYENYFTENTGTGGATVNTYNRITYKNIYPQIDWVLYTRDGQLEHEFVIHEGGRASDIQLKYGGASNLKINTDGSLTATTVLGTITEHAPKSYRPNGSPVKSGFKLRGDILTYETDGFNGELVIDPTLQWATYYGSDSSDLALGVTTDPAGNVFICGTTFGLTGIATSGAYDTSFNGYFDAYVAKFNAAGNRIWASYFGGALNEQGRTITCDVNGNVYLAGETRSTGLATAGAYQTTLNGGFNPSDYLAKFSNAGALLWATYYGGDKGAFAYCVATDLRGNVFLTGFTNGSRTGIATPGAYQVVGDTIWDDSYLAKFNSAGNIKWATYYGGTDDETGTSLAIDSAGDIYMIGDTKSTSAIASPGAYQTSFGGGTGYDAMLVKFDSAGGRLWGTYFGGSLGDQAYGSAVDKAGNVYMTGFASSTTGIATPGAYQTTNAGGLYDAFLAKFTKGGARVWATYYGGSGDDAGEGLSIDAKGNLFVYGVSNGTTGIATAGAYQTSYGGGTYDAFLANFDSSGALPWASYFGGNDVDYPGYTGGVKADGFGNVYIAGYTTSTSGIATPGAYQTTHAGGGRDAFLAKFNFCPLPTVGNIAGPSSVCHLATVTLSDTTAGGVWSSSNTGLATVNNAVVVTGAAAGNDTITYSVTNGCGTSTAIFPIKVNALPTLSITPNSPITFCAGDSQQLVAIGPRGGGSAAVLDQSQLNYNSGTSARTLAGYSEWQSFTAGITGTLTQINIGFFTLINGVGTLNIFAGSGTGGTLLQTQTVNVVCGGGNCTLPFTVNAPVTAGQVYTFQFIPGAGMPDPYGIQDVNPGTYAGGEMNIVDPSGTYPTGFDMVFQTFVSSNTGAGYLWSTGSTDTAIEVSATGSYAVTVTDTTGCIASDTVHVTVNPLPTVNAVANQVVCAGDTTTTITFGGSTVSGTVYKWTCSDSTVGIAGSGIGTIASFVAVNNGAASKVATITATPVSYGPGYAYIDNDQSNYISVISTATNTVVDTINVQTGPWCVAVNPVGNRVYVGCGNPSSVTAINTVTNRVIDTVNVATVPYDMVVSPDGSKLYVSCTANVDTSTVSVINTATMAVIDTINISGTSGSICISPDGKKLYLTVSGVLDIISTATNKVINTIYRRRPLGNGLAISPDGSRLYFRNGEGILVMNTSTDSIIDSIYLNPGPQNLVITPDGNKLYATSIAVDSIWVISTLTNSVTGSIYAGIEPFGLSVTPDGSAVYVTNSNSVLVINTAVDSITEVVATRFYQPQEYGNFITSAAGCTGSPITFTITVNPTPTANITTSTGSNNFCQNDSITLTVNTENGYLWSTSQTSQSIVVKQAGTYDVTVSDNNACTASGSKQVFTLGVPTATIAQGDTGICPGDSVTLTASASFQYLWSNNATSQSIVVKQGGSYSVKETNPVGCHSTSAPVTITLNSVPNAAISGPSTVCSNLSATLIATGGTSYSWNNSLGTSDSVTVTPVNATTYIVTVTNSNNCSATASQTVSVTTQPTATISGGAQICAGDSLTLTANGGNSYQWAGGLGTNASVTITPVNTATYTVTAIVGANCSGTASQTVTVNQPATSQFSQTICGGQSFNFNNQNLSQSGAYKDTLQTINGCDSVVTLHLTVGNLIQTAINDSICHGDSILFKGQTISLAGTYKDTLQSAGGCDSVVTLSLAVKPAGVVSAAATKTQFCSGDSVQICATQGFAAYSWNNNDSTACFYTTVAASYSVTAVDFGGCTAASSSPVSISNYAATSVTISRSGDTLTGFGAGGYQWFLNNQLLPGDTGHIIIALHSGDYTVETTDSNGCHYTSTATFINTAIDETAGSYGVTLYPNPNNGQFIIEFTDNATREIEITDALGRIVLASTKMEKQKNFDLEKLSAGIYFLQIRQNNLLKSLKFSVLR